MIGGWRRAATRIVIAPTCSVSPVLVDLLSGACALPGCLRCSRSHARCNPRLDCRRSARRVGFADGSLLAARRLYRRGVADHAELALDPSFRSTLDQCLPTWRQLYGLGAECHP